MCREELIDFDKYLIKEDGSIYSKHWKKQLLGWEDEDGYLVSCLTLKNGKRQPYRINRVIAYLFCQKPKHLENVPYEDLQVGHWDTNRKNNEAQNLYWCTAQENNNNELTKEKQRIRGLNKENIEKLRLAFNNYIKNGGTPPFKEKHHTEESKRKQSVARTKYWDLHRLTDEERIMKRKEYHKRYYQMKKQKNL